MTRYGQVAWQNADGFSDCSCACTGLASGSGAGFRTVFGLTTSPTENGKNAPTGRENGSPTAAKTASNLRSNSSDALPVRGQRVASSQNSPNSPAWYHRPCNISGVRGGFHHYLQQMTAAKETIACRNIGASHHYLQQMPDTPAGGKTQVIG